MPNKKILITGANGQLGSEIKSIANRENFIFTDTAELDITDRQAVAGFISQNNVKIIVNCAAYTNVDKAGEESEKANLINHLAVKNLAEITEKGKVTLIHISTDYVFGGTKNTPYTETDEVSPLGIYGKTKWLGEEAVRQSGANHLIIRTSWLYSRFGHNFVKTIQKLSGERSELNVVFDQTGTPTNAADLAKSIVHIIDNELYINKKETYHFSNEGVCSWYDFAAEIVSLTGNACRVRPCLSAEFPSKVTRPAYSVLDKSKFKTDFGIDIPHWKESLQRSEVV
ncbi:MAG: dTDP-4-dehydrorhamnose reductase [Capnocytophaga sp.]|nr:dTDP-4-dehydrorhamnose reductase [Capnocytophaga sp.]